MSDKTKRILAFVGLFFMAVFSVSFVIFLIKPNLLNGAIAFIALFSFIGGVAILFIIKAYTKKSGKIESAEGGNNNEDEPTAEDNEQVADNTDADNIDTVADNDEKPDAEQAD